MEYKAVVCSCVNEWNGGKTLSRIKPQTNGGGEPEEENQKERKRLN